MKKIFTFIMMCSFFVPVGAQDTKPSQVTQVENQIQKRQELMQKRMQLIAKYPLKDHWTNLQWIIYDYLLEVDNQIRDEADTIEVPFDERRFAGFVNDVRMKLSMPSVTDEERDEVLKTVDEYLFPKKVESADGWFYQDGHLVRLINHLELRGNSEETQVIDTFQFITTKLEDIKEKIETTRIQKA